MTADMWHVQLERMEREFARRGLKPLSEAESELLTAYLTKHSLHSPVGPGQSQPGNSN